MISPDRDMETIFDVHKHLVKHKQEVKNALNVVWNRNEKTLLPFTCKCLVEWAGNHSWKNGFKVDDINLWAREMDYGQKLGVAIGVREAPANTVRQTCYKFVKMADAIREDWEKSVKEYKKTKRYRLFRFLRLIPLLEDV